MKRNKQDGFTLIELMTVIAIIALLAAVILGLAGNAQKTAARKKATAEVEQLSGMATEYQMKYGQVPQTKEIFSNYLDNIDHPLATMMDPWGMSYEYDPTSRQTFYLYSYGGDVQKTNRPVYIGNAP
ncbi:MAG: type II secretion system GspH family protein [Verrucomicrobiota bacterium]|jgi:prepilin-type N-terminal cleavage/methylation domain-containing protein|nr:type II secretion system GspH family protein [Verrucomicrobiota bacterium]